MAKITFVYPDYESLGVEYLMAVALAAGHEVGFLFYEAEDIYLGKTTKVPYDHIATDICRTNPDIVAFSCVTDNFQYQLHCAKSIKKLQQNIYTIFGGIHPTAVPEKTIANDAVDAVAIGEAEYSLIDLLQASESKSQFVFPDKPIPGIMFKKNGIIIGKPVEGKLADLDLLPIPHKSPFFSVLKDSLHEYRIMTSRGCPYHCSYCFNSVMLQLRQNKVIRRRSVTNVITELLWAKAEMGVRRIMFEDDSFTTNRTWIRDFCKRYRSEINLPFACIANPHYIDEEIAETLAIAGCVNIQMGIQSLSETICSEVLDRRSSNARIGEAIHVLKKNGIMMQVDHMLGIPGDTIDKQEESVRYYNIHRPDLVSIFWLTYYPKTPIVEIAQKAGIITQEDIQHIEQGVRLKETSFLTGGSMQDPYPYYCVSFLLNWLPLFPKWFIGLLLNSKLYRLLRIRNYFISTALPRVVYSLCNRRDFRGRSHILRFLGKLGRIGRRQYLQIPSIVRFTSCRKEVLPSITSEGSI